MNSDSSKANALELLIFKALKIHVLTLPSVFVAKI